MSDGFIPSVMIWNVKPNKKFADTVASTLLVSKGMISFVGTSSSSFSNQVVGKINFGVEFVASASRFLLLMKSCKT